jgi:hypothetical protein
VDSTKNILYLIAAILLAYYIIRRLTGKSGKEFNRKFFKYFIILMGLAIGFEILINWMQSTPPIVAQTVEQLKVDPKIRREIGDYNGFGYNKNDIKNLNKLPANLNLTLYGNKGEIQLSVLVDSLADIYEVKDYKVDTIIND